MTWAAKQLKLTARVSGSGGFIECSAPHELDLGAIFAGKRGEKRQLGGWAEIRFSRIILPVPEIPACLGWLGIIACLEIDAEPDQKKLPTIRSKSPERPCHTIPQLSTH